MRAFIYYQLLEASRMLPSYNVLTSEERAKMNCTVQETWDALTRKFIIQEAQQ